MELKPSADIGDQTTLSKNSARLMASGGGTGSADFIPHDEDSIERETILGYQLTNPYLINNMMQAYGNLGLNPAKAVVNNLYVRFLPSTNQLAALDSIMDAQGLELFDTPVDYQVLYEGDYYQDPSIPDSLPTWQYAVVPPSFQFPSGIPHQTLASIHIPADNYTAVETEAERLAAIQDSVNQTSLNGTVTPNTDFQCAPGYEWDPILGHCVPVTPPVCGSGYYWNGEQCVQEMPPPPPAADAAIPAGYIRVHDTQLNTNADEGVGVKKVRVVARRWFKIERTYTDNKGHFIFTKKFKHKVRINVKFKNDDANIYGVRDAMIWQAIFPVKRTLGIFSGDKSNITFVNKQEGSSKSKANRYWAAATVQNCVQEHIDYATQLGFSRAPGALHIFLTNWGITEGLASTPLFHIRSFFGVPDYYVNVYMMNSKFHFASPVITTLVNVVSSIGVDIAIDYHNEDLTRFKSDWLKETVYHELSHGSQYTKMGNTWYLNFVSAELAEIYNYPSGSLNPYGPGNDVNSPIIALGEAWAYHMGHFLADQSYGLQSSEACDQFCFDNNFPVSDWSSYMNALENFDPNYSSDPFHWIPKGLINDLMDTTPTETFPVTDNVSGFTILQLFNALQSDITSVQQYRTRFIQQNPGNQTTNITNLFAQYHY